MGDRTYPLSCSVFHWCQSLIILILKEFNQTSVAASSKMLMSLEKELRLAFKDHNICLVHRKSVDREMEGKDTARMGRAWDL